LCVFIGNFFICFVFSNIFQMSAVATAAVAAYFGRAHPSAYAVEQLTLQCADGLQLAAQRWKSSNTTTTSSLKTRNILMLHGWMDNSQSFALLAPRLLETTKQQVDIVALDFPGHGHSAHKSVQSPPLVIADTVFYVAEALRELNWHETPFTLIGHSMGAGVSCLYSAAFPDHIEKLVLLEGAAPMARNTADISKHIRHHVERRSAGTRNPKVPRVYPSLEVAVKTRCQTARNFPGNQWLSEKAAERMVKRGTNVVDDGNGGSGLTFRHDPRLQWPAIQYMTADQNEAIYKAITSPTALLLAKDGWPFDELSNQKTIDLLGPQVFKTLEGSHHFHADPETSDLVADQVIEFLEL
jgi:pimeloyl-ACP methyl ester carboxylesterase